MSYEKDFKEIKEKISSLNEEIITLKKSIKNTNSPMPLASGKTIYQLTPVTSLNLTDQMEVSQSSTPGTTSLNYTFTKMMSDIVNPNVQVDVSNITGILPPSKGGTGTSTVFTSGSVVFSGSSGTYSQDNANYFWNDTNNTLCIGKNTQLFTSSKLEISGGITGAVRVIETLSTPRSFSTNLEGMAIVGACQNGNLGDHDFGAIAMTNDITGDGGGALMNFHVNGGSSSLSTDSLFMKAQGRMKNQVTRIGFYTGNSPTTEKLAIDLAGNINISSLSANQSVRTDASKNLISIPYPLGAPTQLIYVSQVQGSDTDGNGSESAPFSTYAHAVTIATLGGASAIKPFGIVIVGTQSITGDITLYPFISIIGVNPILSTLSCTGEIKLDSSFNSASFVNFYTQDILLNAPSGINLTFSTFANQTLNFVNVRFGGSTPTFSITGSGTGASNEIINISGDPANYGLVDFTCTNASMTINGVNTDNAKCVSTSAVNPAQIRIINCPSIQNFTLQMTGGAAGCLGYLINSPINTNITIDGADNLLFLDASSWGINPTFLNGALVSNISQISYANGIFAGDYSPSNYALLGSTTFTGLTPLGHFKGIDASLSKFGAFYRASSGATTTFANSTPKIITMTTAGTSVLNGFSVASNGVVTYIDTIARYFRIQLTCAAHTTLQILETSNRYGLYIAQNSTVSSDTLLSYQLDGTDKCYTTQWFLLLNPGDTIAPYIANLGTIADDFVAQNLIMTIS